ncbi:SDR family oxidoreductase [Nocardia sp. NPDC019395]|uniref:SDR family oxidoreductase n=1 Tax=Nocardia sp. NPDC019395 TaxID=3154686 RepID=UPI0033FC1162
MRCQPFRYCPSDVLSDRVPRRGQRDPADPAIRRVVFPGQVPAQIRFLFDSAGERFGAPDIVVNNAGAARFAPIAIATDDDFERMVAVNAKAAFVTLREAANRVRDGGRIAEPADIADIVAFLSSDDARWVTGASLPAGGGLF